MPASQSRAQLYNEDVYSLVNAHRVDHQHHSFGAASFVDAHHVDPVLRDDLVATGYTNEEYYRYAAAPQLSHAVASHAPAPAAVPVAHAAYTPVHVSSEYAAAPASYAYAAPVSYAAAAAPVSYAAAAPVSYAAAAPVSYAAAAPVSYATAPVVGAPAYNAAPVIHAPVYHAAPVYYSSPY